MKKRYLARNVIEDLAEKMVFVGGPRQVGKTTLADDIAHHAFRHSCYLNWDSRKDRQVILQSQFPEHTDLLVFDEIHKYGDWTNYVKGLYDTQKDRYRILVTGSARLDLYRRGGDSMMGRYHYYRLHPFTVAEYLESRTTIKFPDPIEPPAGTRAATEAAALLMKFGGFPEPLLRQSETFLRRWQDDRTDRLVRGDIRDMQSIRDLSSLQILVDMLPGRVGSLLSLNSLREDLEVAHKTVAAWVDTLEVFYHVFRIHPFHHDRIRSLRKNPKLYLWDWSEVPDEAARMENMVASHLLKLCHFLRDVEGYRMELFFLRDREGREVDFMVAERGKPWFAVEVKTSAQASTRTLSHFGRKLSIPYLYQVVGGRDVHLRDGEVVTMSLDKFLAALV